MHAGAGASGGLRLGSSAARHGFAAHRLARPAPRQRHSGLAAAYKPRVDNLELLIGDALCLVTFSMYKQIDAIVLSPSFPGWLAPLHFNPARFAEFISFSSTLTLTWVACAFLLHAYESGASADVPTALRRTCYAWLSSMPVCAAQLVLLTAAEERVLVGTDGFATALPLPLAASGPGEPFVTAAGVLGVMCAWRAFYVSVLDISNAWTDRAAQQRHLEEAARSALLLSAACCAALTALGWAGGDSALRAGLNALAAPALGGQ